MSKLFAELTSGASFKKPVNKGVKPGNGASISSSNIGGGGKQKQQQKSTKAAPTAALDFFGAATAALPQGKKRKASIGEEGDGARKGAAGAGGGAQTPSDGTLAVAGKKEKKKSKQTRDEEVAAFRRRLGIKISGDDCPPPVDNFAQLPFDDGPRGRRARQATLSAIEESQWTEPTAVQMQCIPAMVSGRDVVANAPTGSGKTAAYALPAIIRLSMAAAASKEGGGGGGGGVRALFMAPTRELAAQIHREVSVLVNNGPVAVNLLTKARAANLSSSVAASAQVRAALAHVLARCPLVARSAV